MNSLMSSLRNARVIIVSVSLCTGCRDADDTQAKPTPGNARATARVKAETGEPQQSGRMERVPQRAAGGKRLPTQVEATPALAVRLCNTLHGYPAQRKASCCHYAYDPHKDAVRRACERTLGAALKRGAISVDRARLKTCQSSLKATLGGCAWVTPSAAPAPPACSGVLSGLVTHGHACRSTLECKAPLRCAFANNNKVGTCRPPAAAGQACGEGGDTLATYARHRAALQGRTCEAGYCRRRRCTPFQRLGRSCETHLACGPENHCDGERCVKGPFAKRGQSCTAGACQLGLRCIMGRCDAPGEIGAPCRNSRECKAICRRRSPGDRMGSCQTQCSYRPSDLKRAAASTSRQG